jgi:hypothetical protein
MGPFEVARLSRRNTSLKVLAGVTPPNGVSAADACVRWKAIPRSLWPIRRIGQSTGPVSPIDRAEGVSAINDQSTSAAIEVNTECGVRRCLRRHP